MAAAGAAIGGLMALRFIWLQLFVLKQVCTFCMIVDVSAVIALILGIALLIKIVRLV
jgi:uncharacterized membrane protein